MTDLEKTKIQIGYIPLLDCIAILWAKQRGFFDELGLEVSLVKETSWASLRDRLAFGVLDVAHCLSAMLPAAALGEDQLGIPFQTNLVLSQNRAFISLSQKLCHQLDISHQDSVEQSAQKITLAMKNGQSIRLANVFKQSIHHYCLRQWLALADLDVAKNCRLVTLPPPYMVEAISNQLVDGFCVGEPWNIQGELSGISQMVASSQHIIPEIADKVLAFTQEWAAQHPNTLKAITQAIVKAQHELQHLTDFDVVWQLLIEFNIIQFECSETIHVEKYYSIQNIIRNLVKDSSTPKVDDFHWLIEQMIQWDDAIIEPNEIARVAESCSLAL